MKALCLITVKPGKVDTVVEILKKKRKIIKNVMIVTGRADVTAVLNGNIDEINNTVIDFKKIKEIVTTEKLIDERLRKVNSVYDSFPTSGQFDAVAIIDVEDLGKIKDVTNQIQKINGVERTETMVEVQ